MSVRGGGGVALATLYNSVAQAYQEEGAEQWPLYRRYEVVEWSGKEEASARADACGEPVNRADQQQPACASDGGPDAVDAQGAFEHASMDERELAVKDEAASAATAGSGASTARSPTISDDSTTMRRHAGKRYTPSQRAEVLAYAAEHG